jgi:hypothetical protein
MSCGKTMAAGVNGQGAGENRVRTVVGLRRWLRLTARKHSVAKLAENDAAKAAADALAAMLNTSRKLG